MSSTTTATAAEDGSQVHWVDTHDRRKLFAKVWTPAPASKAAVVMLHGFGEHSERYAHVARAFAAAGLTAIAFDQRGHGHTKINARGDAGAEASDINHDLEAVIAALSDSGYAFSMGALFATRFLAFRDPAKEKARPVKGIVATGPLFAPGTPPPAIKVFFANIVKSIPGVNRITLDAALDYTTLTRSPENLEAYKKDPLVQGKMSLRTAGAILGGGKFMLNEGWKKFNTPVLIVHGGKDKINSPVASKAFFDKIASADKKYTLLEENYHELHQEPEKDAIIASYVEWILEQISKQPVEAAEPAAEPVVVAEPIEASKPVAEPVAEHVANPEPVVAAETETKSE